ncbi:hypothetical protein KR093_007526, partial [Drosophila rubida]
MLSSLMARTAALTMAVYFTNRVGIWGNSDASDKLCERISNSFEPMRQLTKSKVKKYYELSVKEGCQLARQLPGYTNQLVNLAKTWSKHCDKLSVNSLHGNQCNVPQPTRTDSETAGGFRWLPVITAGDEGSEQTTE